MVPRYLFVVFLTLFVLDWHCPVSSKGEGQTVLEFVAENCHGRADVQEAVAPILERIYPEVDLETHIPDEVMCENILDYIRGAEGLARVTEADLQEAISPSVIIAVDDCGCSCGCSCREYDGCLCQHCEDSFRRAKARFQATCDGRKGCLAKICCLPYLFCCCCCCPQEVNDVVTGQFES